MFEICLKRGWAVPAKAALDLCKMVEKRMSVISGSCFICRLYVCLQVGIHDTFTPVQGCAIGHHKKGGGQAIRELFPVFILKGSIQFAFPSLGIATLIL